MKKLTILLALLIASSAYAADRADEVRQTEIGFAKAFADRDAAKFFSFVTDDANFLGPKRILAGKAEVVKVWTEYLKPEKAPFRWEPERVVVNAKGDLGLSTGPVYDAEGKHIGNYSSIWQRQSDGTWKIVFDGPGGPVCETK
ncbi:MAG TPA: nuclear transport factor 2 family protein [Thermoanaerobaculia bacterium]|nr:nuclear transport factor 2 family protein [Thermoanaerobaculia bacterium]